MSVFEYARRLKMIQDRDPSDETGPIPQSHPDYPDNDLSDEDAYETDDPKHEDYHSTHADLWDMREGK
jgi:hypothetical protein